MENPLPQQNGALFKKPGESNGKKGVQQQKIGASPSEFLSFPFYSDNSLVVLRTEFLLVRIKASAPGYWACWLCRDLAPGNLVRCGQEGAALDLWTCSTFERFYLSCLRLPLLQRNSNWERRLPPCAAILISENSS